MESLDINSTLAGKPFLFQEKWNDYYVDLYLPNIILVICGLLIGVPSNLIVIFIYVRRLKLKGSGRYFIPILAGVDLFGVSISCTYNLLVYTRRVTFPASWICKTFKFCVRVVICYSIAIMTIIAIFRFQKLYKKIKCHLSFNHLKLFIVCGGMLCFALNIPTLIIYDKVEIAENNLTGYMCRAQMKYADIEKSSVVFFVIWVFGNIAIGTILYAILTKHIFKTSKAIADRLREGQVDEGDSIETLARTHTKNKRNLGWSYRVSVMFMFLTLETWLACIPPLIIKVLEDEYPEIWNGSRISYTNTNFLMVLRKLYILNYIANPFIYGVFDRAFRRELRSIGCGTG